MKKKEDNKNVSPVNEEDDPAVEGILFSDDSSDCDSDVRKLQGDDVFSSDDPSRVITQLWEDEPLSFLLDDEKLEIGIQSRDSSSDSSSSELLSAENSLDRQSLECEGFITERSPIELVGVSDFPE